MSIDNVTNTPAAPAHTPIVTDDMEDYGSRIQAVTDNARAESKASRRDEANEDPDIEGELDTSTDEETSGIDEDGNDKPAKAVAKEKPAPVAPAAPTAEETARKASLANAARLERESVKKSTELSAKTAELKATEAKMAEREKVLSDFEKAYKDPDALLSLLADKISPDKMAQFFIEQGQPDKVAERRAKAAQEPVNSELTKLNEEIKKLREERQSEIETTRAVAARQENEKLFSERVLDLKADAPLAARLLNKRPKEFFALADQAATQLLADAKAKGAPLPAWDDVILDVQKQLYDFNSALTDEQAAQAAPSTPEKPTKHAAAKAPTVSNRDASERSAILNEDEKWDSLPFDERVKRAEKRARQTG